MALSALAPAARRSSRAVISRSTRVVLKLVPELKPVPGEQASDRLFYGLIGAILSLGLLGLLGINLLLGHDAVRIRELKLEVIAINEEREAALRQVATISTPENLARRAVALGMVPSDAPIFLDISVDDRSTGESAKAGQR